LTVDGTGSIDFNDVGENISSPSAGILAIESRGPVLVYGDSNNNGTPTSAIFTVYRDSTYAGGTSKAALNVKDNGDISFYDDTGTSQALFWDAGAESLGIGTTSPDAPLRVVATAASSIPALGAASSHAAIGAGGFGTMFGTKSTGVGYIQQQRFDGTATAYNLLLQPNGGKVGIGTDSPSAKLSIHAAVNNPAIEIVPTTDENSADSAVLRLWGTRFGTANRYSEIRNVTDGSTANNELAFNTNGSEALRIDSSQRVGIGTASPSTYGVPNAQNLVIGQGGASTGITLSAFGTASSSISFSDQSNPTSARGYMKYDHNGDYLAFAANGSEKARLNSSGLDVTGTISSGAITSTGEVEATALDINGNGDISGNLTLGGYLAGPATFTIDPAAVGDNTGTVVIAGNLQVDGTTTTINSTTLTVDDKLITLASGSANAAAANGAGIEVEISGATNPSLTYDGTNDEWDFNKSVNVTGSVKIANTNNPAKLFLRDSRASSNSEISQRSDGRISLAAVAGSYGTSGIEILSNGNVGIGTTSPSQKLEIAGYNQALAENTTLRFTDTDTSSQTNQLFGKIEFNSLDSDAASPNRAYILAAAENSLTPSYIAFGTAPHTSAATEAMRIDSSGNLLLGDTSTAGNAKFYLRNGSSGQSYSNVSGMLIDVNGTSNSYYGLRVGSSTGNSHLAVTNAGNVGIGNTSPAAKLQVEEYGIDTTETSTTATTQVAIHTMSATAFRSARFTVQVTNSTDSTYHLTEILMIHDGTTPSITEYGTIFTGSAEATFDADISSGNVRLLATPASTDTMEFKVVAHSITT
jgi:hypothetical protein